MREEPNRQDIHFPHLALCLRIVRDAGAAVSISVSTDDGELIDHEEIGEWIDSATTERLRVAEANRHQARNRMYAISLGLQVLTQRLETWKNERVDELLEAVINEFNAIECLLSGDEQGAKRGS